MQAWHALSAKQTFEHLEADEVGLGDKEATNRLKRYGYNELKLKGDPWWKKLTEPFRNIFIAILGAAAAISFASHETLDGFIILTIIGINTAIYYSQQYATSRVLRSLKKHSEQYVQVMRNGQETKISSRLLVPGDVLILTEGERVPADARVISDENLYLDESALTGESLPINKTSAVIAEKKKLYERINMVFQGTYVVAGTGRAVVVATGSSTEFGAIAELAAQKEPESPVQQKVNRIVSKLIRVLALVALIAFALSLWRGIPTAEALRFVMALSVSAVPEGLPIALTVIVVLGMRRMAKKKALVRSFKAIEDIGLVTTIATDKTGTLTKNDLSVVDHWVADDKADIRQASLRALGKISSSIEPFDNALNDFALSAAAGAKLIKNYSFNQEQRMSGAAWEAEGKALLYIKGAPEHIIKLSVMSASQRRNAESQLQSMVANGYRVIGLAVTAVKHPPPDLQAASRFDYKFLGLVAFADELRKESKTAIMRAHRAGIKVKMITGDHRDTAFHIGKTLGITDEINQIMVGSELPKSEKQLSLEIANKSVFARILPKQKFDILKALKRNEITAMTGDGVNDVPALVNANVGIAMGSGNDIAKDAGDIVLLDNNFASIVRAISEGRVIYDNIRRMLFYLLSTSFGEVLTMVGALIVGLPLPVTAIMILWINLVTDTALVIPLGLEPAEKGHMDRPPRHPKEPILDRMILSRIVLIGFAMAASTLTVFSLLISSDYPLVYAQTIAFMMLVVAQWSNAFNARSELDSLGRRLRVRNDKILVGLSIAALLQSLVIFGPLGQYFGVVEVSIGHLLVGMAISAASVISAAEIHKYYYRKRATQTSYLTKT